MTARSRRICALLVLAGVLATISPVRHWLSIGPPLDRTSDFAGTYVAATLWRQGERARLYDVPTEEAALAATGAPPAHDFIPFVNPPAAVLLALPTTAFDGGTAWRIWSILQVVLLFAGMLIVIRVAEWPSRAGWLRAALFAMGAAATGSIVLFVEGQWDGFSVLGLAGAWALWKRDRRFAAGLVLGLLAGVAKPHLLLGIAAFVAGRRDRRAVLGGVCALAVLVAVSFAMVGGGGMAAYASELARPANTPIGEMLGFSGLFGSWLGVGVTDRTASAGATTAVYVLTALFTLAGMGVAAVIGDRVRRRPELFDDGLAAATVISLLVAPHLLNHDLTLLVPPLIWLVAARAARAPRTWPDAAGAALIVGWIALSVVALVDLGQDTSAPPGRLTPWLLIAAAVWGTLAVLRAPGKAGALPQMREGSAVPGSAG